MNPPTVSVVMSVFNGQAFLREAVESILGQTHRDFEFIIIDDGSMDKTSEILASYASDDSRMRIVQQENKGRATSLNIGMNLARSKYIARMDADDISLPDRLKLQLEFMDHHPEVGVLGGAIQRIDSRGTVLHTDRPPRGDSEIKALMLQYNPMYHSAILMRKEVAVASGGYRKVLLDADDYDLWLRMGERTRLANLDECVVLYRIHRNQVSILKSSQQTLCVIAARTAAAHRRKGSGDPLTGVEEISAQLLRTLGVTRNEIQAALLGCYRFWMKALDQSDPEAALRVTEGFLSSGSSGFVDRRVLADVWLKAAYLQYGQGRPISALISTARGLMLRPIVAGRPVKRAFMRLASGFKG